MSQSRLWIIVWNNYPEDWKDWIAACGEHPDVQWIGGVPEVAPSTGTPHIQGNVYFRRKVVGRKATEIVSEFLYGVHIGDHRGGPCRGNFASNCAYITKTGAELFECGDRPAMSSDGGEGDRWKAVRELALAGRFDTLEEEYFDIWLRYESKLRKLYRVQPLDFVCEVIWVYGPPRSGKDRLVRYEMAIDCYVHSSTQWFDEYTHQKDVYFPDMDPDIASKLGAHFLKNLCDRHVMKVQIKGSMIDIRPERILFTSNYTPEECFAHFRPQDRAALLERVTSRLQMPPMHQ